MLLKGNKFKNQSSGILLAISSLPSKYGIGSLGEEAYKFIDFLKNSNQTIWQMLPLVPIGKGNSPYSSQSAFAGEILLIDIDLLIKDGLLDESDIPQREFPQNVNYSLVKSFKLPLLKKAAKNFDTASKEFKTFRDSNHWLSDYCLFMAFKSHFGNIPFYKWDDAVKYRQPAALEEFKETHSEQIEFYEITQFLFYKQYFNLKEYAKTQGIKLVGDIPFYVSLDSADVWANPECFKLGRDMTPMLVAGVPPDIFSSTGQLWGNPVYDWEYHKKTDYSWWKKRLCHNAKLYDIIRIDHFRAFADYYTIPYGSPDAKSGKWERGVGMHFWNKMKPFLEDTLIIAEDLGGETPEVRELIERSGFPDMKVLQFAFDSDLKDPFLPKNMHCNCVCYTGTHDNDTTLGWFQKITPDEENLFRRLVPTDKSRSPVLSLIAFGMKSRAETVIIPLQDYLELPSTARMNTPGNPKGNWEWRFSSSQLTEDLSQTIRRLTKRRNQTKNRS